MLMMRDIAVQHKKEMGEHAITKLQDWQDDPVLFTYCTHPKVTQVRKTKTDKEKEERRQNRSRGEDISSQRFKCKAMLFVSSHSIRCI